MSEEKRLVWDLPLRLFHWLLVLSLVGSYMTAHAGPDWIQVHARLGYWTAGLLIFRVLWGLCGPTHARFRSFLAPPRKVVQYIRGLLEGANVHHVGHNPLGGWMVIAILLSLTLQVATGLFATDDIAWTGPYYSEIGRAHV